MSAALLSPPAARVFYSAADAWYPVDAAAEGDHGPGASRVDLLAYAPALWTGAEVRRLEWELRFLEWLPRFALRRSGFSWLSEGSRRALLEGLRRSRFAPLRTRVERLRAMVDACYEAARASHR